MNASVSIEVIVFGIVIDIIELLENASLSIFVISVPVVECLGIIICSSVHVPIPLTVSPSIIKPFDPVA